MDSHIFADPDPGSQNFADPTDLDLDPDPDPKHCFKHLIQVKSRFELCVFSFAQ